MPYAQIHTQAPRHPKLLALSDAAWRLWATGLCYVQEHMTDGLIPAVALVTFGVAKHQKAADELVAVCLWHQDREGYRVHDYGDWNHTREEVAKRQSAKRERWARWKARQQQPSIDAPQTRLQTDCELAANASSSLPQPQPQPQPQVQDQEHVGSAGADRRAPDDDGFDAFWAAYPKHTAKQDAQKAWRKLKPSPALQEIILAAIADQQTWRQWREGFVPHPATWLHGRRWDDERPAEERGPANRAPTGVSRPWCEHDPPCHTQPEHVQRVLAEDRARREAVPA